MLNLKFNLTLSALHRPFHLASRPRLNTDLMNTKDWKFINTLYIFISESSPLIYRIQTGSVPQNRSIYQQKLVNVQFPASESYGPINFFPQTLPTNLKTPKETYGLQNQNLLTNAHLLTYYLNFPKTNSIFLLQNERESQYNRQLTTCLHK